MLTCAVLICWLIRDDDMDVLLLTSVYTVLGHDKQLPRLQKKFLGQEIIIIVADDFHPARVRDGDDDREATGPSLCVLDGLIPIPVYAISYDVSYDIMSFTCHIISALRSYKIIAYLYHSIS